RRRHTISDRDWISDVCSSDLQDQRNRGVPLLGYQRLAIRGRRAAATSNREPLVSEERYSAVSLVLVRVLVLNLAVALSKIVFGYASGAISILSDGFHSLTDAASNVAGLVGVRAAVQPPDEDHPYGHRKYETVAAASMIAFLLLVVIEVLRNAFN